MKNILVHNFKQLVAVFVLLMFVQTSEMTQSFSNILIDQPLLLSAYIENGDIETGRLLSKVGPLPNAPSVPSFSGFITVDKEYNSNLFFWFFPALNNDQSAPILLWLQGGPGASDFMGLFVEHGPYFVYPNYTAGLREHTWAKEFHVLYVDSPVGTGFSFTDDVRGYATNQDQITEDLYSFLTQFFNVYYEYRRNDLYICGESYGGKHVPYLGYKFHIHGPPAEITFKGIAIGNGVFGMNYVVGLPELFYQLGIVDKNQSAIMKNLLNLVIYYAEQGETLLALKEFNKVFGHYKDPDVASYTNYVTDVSGFDFHYNFLFTKKPEDYLYYENYIQSSVARKAIHVGNIPLHGETTVQHYLERDIFKSSSKDKLSVLMENYKVLVYSGQLDIIVPYVITESLLKNLTWKHSEDYRSADRRIWKIDDYVAGYVKSVGSFFEVLVRNAGHLVPHDQPQAALDLITRFIKDVPFSL